MFATLHSFVSLAVAFALGTAIGFERQWRQRAAGLRTNVLVAVGAAAFADIGMRLTGGEGAVRVISYVVSGIGFLGAGAILKEGASVRGLNTAATLWCSAAVGTFAGTGLTGEAMVVTFFVLAGNTLLRPMVDWVNRRPIRQGETEAEYRLHVTTGREHVADVRDLLDLVLTRANYPVRDVSLESASESEVGLAAALVPTTADPDELDEAVNELEASPLIRSATWSVTTPLS